MARIKTLFQKMNNSMVWSALAVIAFCCTPQLTLAQGGSQGPIWPVCDAWDRTPDEETEPFCRSNPPTPSCDDEFPSEHCLPCFNATMYWWTVKTITPVCLTNNGSIHCPPTPGPPCFVDLKDIEEVLTCPDYCGSREFTFAIGVVWCEVCP